MITCHSISSFFISCQGQEFNARGIIHPYVILQKVAKSKIVTLPLLQINTVPDDWGKRSNIVTLSPTNLTLSPTTGASGLHAWAWMQIVLLMPNYTKCKHHRSRSCDSSSSLKETSIRPSQSCQNKLQMGSDGWGQSTHRSYYSHLTEARISDILSVLFACAECDTTAGKTPRWLRQNDVYYTLGESN